MERVEDELQLGGYSRMSKASPPFGAEHSLHVEVELCGVASRPSISVTSGRFTPRATPSACMQLPSLVAMT